MSKNLSVAASEVSKYMEQCANLMDSVETTWRLVLELSFSLESTAPEPATPEPMPNFLYRGDSVIGNIERATELSCRTNEKARALLGKIRVYLGDDIKLIG